MWTVFFPFSKAQLANTDAGNEFFVLPKLWYELAYISFCHYDGVLTAQALSNLPPLLTGKAIIQTLTL